MTEQIQSISATLEQLLQLGTRVPTIERLPLAQSHGRALAEPIAAALDLPPFDSAAMDGYAVHSDAKGPLSIIGEARAGHPFQGRLGRAEAVRIMTGAPLPEGADTVVMLEHTEIADGRMRTEHALSVGLNVRRRGEHVKAGERVLEVGQRMDVAQLALAASVGCAAIAVFRRVRVALLSTGDELMDPPATLSAGSIFDGNRPMLRAQLDSEGCDVTDLGIVADQPTALQQAIAHAAPADVVLTTGGAALGDADFVSRQPGVRFISVDMRPGRGIVAGRVAGGPLLLGLPGNGVAAYVVMQLLAMPLIRSIGGYSQTEASRLHLPLAVAASGKARSEWRRARLVMRGGASAVEPLADQGSAMVRTLCDADALIEIPAGQALKAGSIVNVILLN